MKVYTNDYIPKLQTGLFRLSKTRKAIKEYIEYIKNLAYIANREGIKWN